MSESTIFQWNAGDLDALLATCETDGLWPHVERHVPAGGRVLELGCGAGRWVRFLRDRGYHAVGVEWSGDTLRMVRRRWPDLPLARGDAAAAPIAAGSFDAVVSLGVVEHWPAGPARALGEIARVLRPGGVALITVPCQNAVRRLKRRLWWDEVAGAPRALAAVLLRGRRWRPNRLERAYRWAVHPAFGAFVEYRLTPGELRAAVADARLELLEHHPFAVLDGLYHDLDPFHLLVRFRNWSFEAGTLARRLNELLARWPFLHCHMQLVVARRPNPADRSSRSDVPAP